MKILNKFFWLLEQWRCKLAVRFIRIVSSEQTSVNYLFKSEPIQPMQTYFDIAIILNAYSKMFLKADICVLFYSHLFWRGSLNMFSGSKGFPVLQI